MVDKVVTQSPLPTPYEREIPTILIEECAEIQQGATKLLRFGADKIEPGDTRSNSTRLALEIGDLLEMFEMATDAEIVTSWEIAMGRAAKREKLAMYMQTEPPTAQAGESG